MLGAMRFARHGRGKPVPASIYGLCVLRSEVDPEGFWGERRLKKAGRALHLGGVARLLAPERFGAWNLLSALGLRPVEPEPFLRSQSVPLVLESLERLGLAPDRATVALRGRRVDRSLRQAAAELCPRVRNLVVDVPGGGRELEQWLRWEFGIPILPREAPGEVGLHFQPGGGEGDRVALDLYGPSPTLGGLVLSAPALREEDRENLSLLTALWEGGKLGPEDIKILDRSGTNTYHDTESAIVPTEL